MGRSLHCGQMQQPVSQSAGALVAHEVSECWGQGRGKWWFEGQMGPCVKGSSTGEAATGGCSCCMQASAGGWLLAAPGNEQWGELNQPQMALLCCVPTWDGILACLSGQGPANRAADCTTDLYH